MMMITRAALCLCAGLAVTACGGGGGGAGDPAPNLASVPFTPANYDPTGRATAAVLIDVQASSTVEGVASADGGRSPAATTAGVFAVTQMAFDRAQRAATGRAQVAASSTETNACAYGGSFTVTLNDNNNNNTADAGDTATSNFSACVDELGAPAISGGLDFTVKAVGSNVVTLGLTFRNLASGGSTINGAAEMSLGNSAVSVKYQNAASVRNGKTTYYNFTANGSKSGNMATMGINGDIGVSGALYTLSTPIPIIMGTAYPSYGTLRISDSAGGRVDVVMRATDFDLELYLPGDAVRDAKATYTWAALASGSI